MAISTNNPLSDTQATQFFAAPDVTRQRQYEALRAYFLDNRSAADVAAGFGYSLAAFRSLAHQFRHDPGLRAGFFQTARPGPQHAPARDRVRELVVAMRKRNLSVYDIQEELAAAGHTISAPKNTSSTRPAVRNRSGSKYKAVATAFNASATKANDATKPAAMKAGRAPARRPIDAPSKIGSTGSVQGAAIVRMPANNASGRSGIGVKGARRTR